MNEQFSAFLDNEAARDEADSVVNALLRDEALRESWTRQHWVRTTLRTHSAEPAVAVDAGFAGRVMRAIEAEQSGADYPRPAAAGPSGTQAKPALRVRRGRRWRGMAGLAAAASVAGVVFLVGNPLLRSGQTGSQTGSRVAHTGSSAARASRSLDNTQSSQVSFGSDRQQNPLADFGSISSRRSSGRVHRVTVRATQSSDRPRARMMASNDSAAHWSVSDPAVRNELNGYLVDHDGMARGYGLSSTTPDLVRVATYGQGAVQ